MTPEQIALVQASSTRLAPHLASTSVAFYERFFAADPQARALFPQDMAAQQRKFIEGLRAIVAAVSDFPAFAVRTAELGELHQLHRVKAEHYATAGVVLLGLLAEVDEAHWTPELAQAWATAYDLVAESMMLAGRS